MVGENAEQKPEQPEGQPAQGQPQRRPAPDDFEFIEDTLKRGINPGELRKTDKPT